MEKYYKHISRISSGILLFFLVSSGLLFSSSLVLTSCHSYHKDNQGINLKIKYSHSLIIKKTKTYTSVSIIDPWDSTAILGRYILVRRDWNLNKKNNSIENSVLPPNMPDGHIILVPIRKAAVYNAVHTSILEELNATSCIAAVCEPKYIASKKIHELIDAGEIIDLGPSTAPSIEKIIDTGCDVIILSPFKNSGLGAQEKLDIPIIQASDYMEASSLGRTEWIKFFGLLTGKEALADSLFKDTESKYLDLKKLASTANNKPSLLPEKKYGSTWFVPGGLSSMSKLYADAGTNYLFSNNEKTGGVPMSFETVLDQAIHADIWLFKYYQNNDYTLKNLKQEYEPYCNFDAFKKKHIYGANTSKTSFFDDIVLHPDWILKDVIALAHPELLPDYQIRYFKKLTTE
ncbi:MAG: ABC transporter substrate-binding protein [Bacteroidales bacterium]